MSPTTARARRRSLRRPAALAAAVATALTTALAAGLLAAVPASAVTAPTAASSAPRVTAQQVARVAAARAAMPDLGDHVVVVDPTMTTAQIQAAADAITAQQVDDEMGPGRWALLFLPGSYGSVDEPLQIQVGYGTEVAGLGRDPGDVQVTGKIEVFNRCLAPDNCIALDNFWRSLANLTIHVAGGADPCRQTANFWAVSQASPMRRVQVDGNLSLMDYCTAGPQYASGGFIADSRTSTVTNGSQQQFLVRDSSIATWSNGVWNQVFSGVEGAPQQSFPSQNPGPYTTLDTTPVSRERPYLFVDDTGAWNVLVPDARTGSRGPTWSDTTSTPGTVVPLSAVHVAHPGDTVASMNAALRAGRHLLLTPGQYAVPQSIVLGRDRQLLLGLGLPALTAVGGAVPVVVQGRGDDVAGIMVDAGTTWSPALVRVGGPRSRDDARTTPTGLQDVFFRVGGPHAGRAGTALVVTADDVVLDDIWAWRADHGQGVGWTVNPADHGVVVTGDRVTATGLFAEHFEKDNVVWSGEDGRTVFFQNELPYDAPDQASWRHGRTLGYAGYAVTPNVKRHELWGGGVYVFTNVNPSLHASSGFSVPVRPGVRLHDLLTVDLGAGTIDHVVNDVGAPVTTAAIGVPSFVTSYP